MQTRRASKKELRFVNSNLVSIPAKPNEIQIDIDSRRDLQFHHRQWKAFRKALEIAGFSGWTRRIKRSRNGNWHISVYMPFDTLSHVSSIGIAAVLGSDRVRELMNLSRVMRGSRHPVVFFEAQAKRD